MRRAQSELLGTNRDLGIVVRMAVLNTRQETFPTLPYAVSDPHWSALRKRTKTSNILI